MKSHLKFGERCAGVGGWRGWLGWVVRVGGQILKHKFAYTYLRGGHEERKVKS